MNQMYVQDGNKDDVFAMGIKSAGLSGNTGKCAETTKPPAPVHAVTGACGAGSNSRESYVADSMPMQSVRRATKFAQAASALHPTAEVRMQEAQVVARRLEALGLAVDPAVSA